MSEREPEEAAKGLTFVPAEEIGRLYSCPECGDEYISPNAMAKHHSEEHGAAGERDSG
jgi:hypothetical protein